MAAPDLHAGNNFCKHKLQEKATPKNGKTETAARFAPRFRATNATAERKTGRLATQNRPFGNAKQHIPERKMTAFTPIKQP